MEKDFGYTDNGLGPQIRSHKDVPSLTEVVFAHFKSLAKPEQGDGRISDGVDRVVIDPQERDGR